MIRGLMYSWPYYIKSTNVHPSVLHTKQRLRLTWRETMMSASEDQSLTRYSGCIVTRAECATFGYRGCPEPHGRVHLTQQRKAYD